MTVEEPEIRPDIELGRDLAKTVGAAVGVYFLLAVGLDLLPIFAIGALAALTYTDLLAKLYVGEFFAALEGSSPLAMIAGQTVLAAPIVANLVLAAVTGADSRIINTALTLGASRLQAAIKLLSEVRFGVMAAVIAGFGRVIAEVGVAMMLGGNIRNSTRTMTTAIALETSKGEFAQGIALGIILLLSALLLNFVLSFIQARGDTAP